MSSDTKKITEESFWHLDTKDLSVQQIQGLLVGGVAPRPIALVSTLSEKGQANLAPFSFFNAFGSNPPVVAFSPARRGRDGSLKDTYRNLVETNECVIQIVTHPIVEQVNVASTEFASGVDEFTKSGLTKVASHVVKPFRVLESPFQMECKLIQMIHLGGQNGSGNLAVCEVLKFHVSRDLYVEGKIQVEKMDQVGRNGGAYYTRSIPTSMFEIHQPVTRIGVGYDQLPKAFRESHDLSANDLGQLATLEKAPSQEDAKAFVKTAGIKKGKYLESAKQFLRARKTADAWNVLLVHFQK